jgi:hypothetical protein
MYFPQDYVLNCILHWLPLKDLLSFRQCQSVLYALTTDYIQRKQTVLLP